MNFIRRLLQIVTAPLRAVLYSPARLLSPVGRLLKISLPAQVAVLTAIFLVIVVVIVVVYEICRTGRPPLYAKLGGWFWPVIVGLAAAIPFVVYKALKLWLEGDVSPFPDIDNAWKAGLAELEQHGLDLSQIPLFLILGSERQQQEKALMDASRLSLNVREFPQGPAAVHWYANPDGVYLVCSETSSLSKLSRVASGVIQDEKSRPGPVSPQPAGGPIRGTIVAGGHPAAGDSAAMPGPVPSGAAGGEGAPQTNIRGTMVVGSQTSIAGGDISAAAERRVIRLQQEETNEQDRRLEYLCRLIRRARQPLCPINGILTLLPFGLIQRSVPEAIEVQRSVKKDLSTVMRVLMVRCPVTAMVVGLEAESGFRELVRRVGRDRALGQRFGKGFSVWNPPIPERLDALATHACGSFEDWVYTLFREKGSLSKPGNTKLYSLLCNIRRNVQSRLANVLVAGYGAEEGQEPRGQSFLFGGCYFAAIGETEDRQAFVKSVFDKLPEQQEELRWTDDALGEDQRYQQLAQLGLAIDALLLLGLAALIVHKWVYPFW